MNGTAATLNIVIGLAYCSIGVMTGVELVRERRTLGYSHFGGGFFLLAWTCGPHHLAHGLHLALEGRAAGGLDIITAMAGLPPGLLWVMLRVEAFRGGRGDRTITGTPWWLHLAMPLFAAYLTALLIGLVHRADTAGAIPLFILPNVLLVPIYMTIGIVMLRTQVRNRSDAGAWSASGLLLSGVFWTCALMHLTWATYAISGRYAFDRHGFVIDWASVPAGLYFLAVVWGLYRDALRDWNRTLPPEPVSAAM